VCDEGKVRLCTGQDDFELRHLKVLHFFIIARNFLVYTPWHRGNTMYRFPSLFAAWGYVPYKFGIREYQNLHFKPKTG